jgi:hypothetical protein
MKYSMTGHENSDLLIQVTAWTGLTVHDSSIKKVVGLDLL